MLKSVFLRIYSADLNICRDFCRKKSNQIENEASSIDEAYYIESQVNIENEIIHNYNKKKIQFALNNLSEEDKNIINLKFYKKLTLREIGEIYDKPHTTVRNHLNKALSNLKESLNKWENDNAY